MSEVKVDKNLRKKIIRILGERGEVLQSPEAVLEFINKELRGLDELEERVIDSLLDSMTEAELEAFGELIFDELLEFIKAEERREKDALNRIYG